MFITSSLRWQTGMGQGHLVWNVSTSCICMHAGVQVHGLCCFPGICSDLNCHISLTFFQLVYNFAQLTLWVMLWACVEDGASGLLLERLHERMKLSDFQFIWKLMHRIVFLLSDIRCAGSPSGVSETTDLTCERGLSLCSALTQWDTCHSSGVLLPSSKGSNKPFNGSAADARAAISYLYSALYNGDPSYRQSSCDVTSLPFSLCFLFVHTHPMFSLLCCAWWSQSSP